MTYQNVNLIFTKLLVIAPQQLHSFNPTSACRALFITGSPARAFWQTKLSAQSRLATPGRAPGFGNRVAHQGQAET
jgi:hypothetical protein